MKATAKLKYMKGSAQKIRLVADLVRGKSVNDAVAILRHTKKVAARDVLKTLRSAVANAEQKEAHLDVDDLVVRKITVDKGPQEKRVRPAPMGRAFQVLHRKSHVTIEVSDEG
jgi:large subunit ribosomal protein L22